MAARAKGSGQSNCRRDFAVDILVSSCAARFYVSAPIRTIKPGDPGKAYDVFIHNSLKTIDLANSHSLFTISSNLCMSDFNQRTSQQKRNNQFQLRRYSLNLAPQISLDKFATVAVFFDSAMWPSPQLIMSFSLSWFCSYFLKEYVLI